MQELRLYSVPVVARPLIQRRPRSKIGSAAGAASSSAGNVFDDVTKALAPPATSSTAAGSTPAANSSQIDVGKAIAGIEEVLGLGGAPKHIASPITALVALAIGLWTIV